MLVAPGCGGTTAGQRQAGASASALSAVGTNPYSVLNWEHKYLKAHLAKIDYLPSTQSTGGDIWLFKIILKSELKNYEVSPYFILKTNPRNKH